MADIERVASGHSSGKLSDLTQHDVKKLLATAPESDHWLLTGISTGLKTPKGGSINITLPGVAGVAAIPAMIYFWGWWQNPFLWAVAVFLGWVAALVVDGLLDGILPSSPGLAAARDTLKQAKRGDVAALDQSVTVSVAPHGAIEFGLPGVGATWSPRGDSDDRKAAAALSVRMQQAFSALGAAHTAHELAPVVAAPPADPWGAKFLAHESAVRGRAGDDAEDVVALMRDIASFARPHDSHDDETRGTVELMRKDALQAVHVFSRLDIGSGALTLPSGLTATQELMQTLTLVRDAARKLHEQGQLTQADELSYLRRVNEMRYRQSDLDID